jgi:hypothetical protein
MTRFNSFSTPARTLQSVQLQTVVNMDHTRHWDLVREQVAQDVAQYGWHLENVLAHWHGSAYSYTVGLRHSFNHPELAVFGLKPSVADLALVRAAREIRGGRQFSPADHDDDLITGWLCDFVPVPDDEIRRLFPALDHYYGNGADVPVHQIVWPGLKGQFPQHGRTG